MAIIPQSFYETYLTSAISATAVTIPVATCPATGVTTGFIRIENEIIKFAGNSNPGGAGNLTSCVRGLALSGTTETSAGLGVAHAAGVAVKMSDVHYYLSNSGGGSGTVTSVSVTTANGVSGSVATETTTPAITLTLGSITPSAVQVSGLTASQILSTDASKNLTSLAVATYPSLTELTYVKGVTSAIQTQLGTKAPSTAPTFATSVTGSYLTASEMLITDGSKNVVSAAVATYPSLTELTYLKGVTSAIQTQFTAKMTNPMTTGGDVIYGGASGAPTRLANGTAGQLLQSNGTTLAPSWATVSGSGDMTKAAYDAANINEQLVGLTATQTLSGKTLTAPKFADLGFIADPNGNEVLQFDTSGASAANFIRILTGNTGSGPTIFADGSDAAVTLKLGVKGAGNIEITGGTITLAGNVSVGNNRLIMTGGGSGIQDSGNNELIKFAQVASAVNEITVTNASTGNEPSISATGGDTDIDILLVGKGTGVIKANAVEVATISGTQTLTNKRVTQRVVTTTDDATAVIDVDVTDVYQLSAVANATTFSTTGTPTDGQKLMIRFKDAGVAKGLTWDAIFVVIGVTAPTTTVAGKWHYVGCQYNSAATKWHILATGVEA